MILLVTRIASRLRAEQGRLSFVKRSTTSAYVQLVDLFNSSNCARFRCDALLLLIQHRQRLSRIEAMDSGRVQEGGR